MKGSLVKGPDARGRYGGYGGRFIPETLMAAVEELALAFDAAQRDPGFQRDFESLSRSFSGRPTPIYLADRLSERAGPVTNRRPRIFSTSCPRQPGRKMKCQLYVTRLECASIGAI